MTKTVLAADKPIVDVAEVDAALQRVADRARTRFEVIDETGRAYVRWDIKVELSYQDDGRTLKVFVRAREAE